MAGQGQQAKAPIVIDVSMSDDEMDDVNITTLRTPSRSVTQRAAEPVEISDSDSEDLASKADGRASLRAEGEGRARMRPSRTLHNQTPLMRRRRRRQSRHVPQINEELMNRVLEQQLSSSPSSSSSSSFSSRSTAYPTQMMKEDQEEEEDASPAPINMAKSSFASYEVKALSKSRIEATRLPDLVQYDQRRNIKYDGQAKLFIAYIRDSELSTASLSITNMDRIDRDNIDAYQPCPPMDFTFTDDYILTDSVGQSGDSSPGCDCDDDECDPATCSCYRLHEANCTIPWTKEYETKMDPVTGEETEVLVESKVKGDFAYAEDGRLRPEIAVYPATPIWECNSRCGCSGDCRNRVVGKGRKVPLDLFKTQSGKGWGVRTRKALPRGTFITVYAGELIDEDESERRGRKYEKVNTSYVFDIDFAHIREKYDIEPYRRHLESHGLPVPEDFDELLEDATNWNKEPDAVYSVDAGLWGNLSRFFNHCCDPNMTVFSVYTQERDLRRPFMAFFTNRYVEAHEELTFDYNSGSKASTTAVLDDSKTAARLEKKLDNASIGQEIKVEQGLMAMKCNCGATNCRGSVFR